MLSETALIGAWDLLEYRMCSPNGTYTFPFGEQAKGLMLFQFDGYMSIVISGIQQPNMSIDFTNNWPVKHLLKINHISYIGNKSIHHVQTTLLSKWKKQQLMRFFNIKANTLLLTTSLTNINSNNQTEKFILVWKKVR